MKILITILFMIVIGHLVDATDNYYREKEYRSAILNAILSAVAIVTLVYTLLKVG